MALNDRLQAIDTSIITPLLDSTSDMGSRSRVRVINVSIVRPPSDTTTDVGSVKLSFFDVMWIYVAPIQRLLFYPTDDSEFPALLQRLRESLSLALQSFRPLSGKLVYSAALDELEIDCSNPGVVFIEAESDEDMLHLAGNDVHDVAGFLSLVPKMDIGELPAPLLSVQVTRFASGIAFGIAIHHLTVDGFATWQFIKSWAEICRTGLHTGSNASWDRSAFRDPWAFEISKRVREIFAPCLPKLTTLGIMDRNSTKLIRRTFIVTSRNVQWLKAQAMHKRDDGSAPVSTFVVVTAHAWVCCTQSKGLHDDDDVYFYFAADCRRHFDPPAASNIYFGNCIKNCFVKAKASQLLGKDGYSFTTLAIQRAIREAQEEAPKDAERLLGSFPESPPFVLNVAGSPRFKVYGTDFGWGRPSRVELLNMTCEGFLSISDAREGGVQVSVALFPLHMDEFAPLFVNGLDGGARESTS